MKRILGYLLVIIIGIIAYQSYINSEPTSAMQALAKSHACAGEDGCEVVADLPNVVKTNVLSQRYQWATKGGPVVVTCERDYLWFGEWTCTRAVGNLTY